MTDNFFSVFKNLPAYREAQYNLAKYQKFVSSYDELTTWPKELRKKIAQNIPFTSINPIKIQMSKDNSTVKLLFERVSDKKKFESVLIKHEDKRNTVCVSCMIGCPVGCFFCATGQMGARGSLTSSEIVDQVLYFARELKNENKKVTNIVFMGMGEPLLNVNNVLGAVDVFCDNKKMAMSKRRITLSTSGITPKIYELLKRGFSGRLTLSLHAPDQALRETLMPIAKKYPLNALIAACKEYAKITKKRVSYEYILIQGVNDSPKHAHMLADLLGSYLTHVNLIPYNPVPNVDYKRSSKNAILHFADILKKQNIPHTVRVTMGDDIAAACGQLVIKNK